MKWRKIKKKFKKEKPVMIGRIMCVTSKSGSQFLMKITDVKIYPVGGNNIKYDYTAEPYERPQMPECSDREQGFSLTFDVGIDTEQTKKQISKFIKQLEQ